MSFSLIVLVAYFELVILVIYTFPFMFFFPNTIVFVPKIVFLFVFVFMVVYLFNSTGRKDKSMVV